MKNWTEKSAIRAISGTKVSEKYKLIAQTGMNGLTACSARDYLVKQCSYTLMSEEALNKFLAQKAEEEKKAKQEAEKAKKVANPQAMKAKQNQDKKANKQRKNFNKAKANVVNA